MFCRNRLARSFISLYLPGAMREFPMVRRWQHRTAPARGKMPRSRRPATGRFAVCSLPESTEVHGEPRGKTGQPTKHGLIVALQVKPKGTPSKPAFYGALRDLWVERSNTHGKRLALARRGFTPSSACGGRWGWGQASPPKWRFHANQRRCPHPGLPPLRGGRRKTAQRSTLTAQP
jgi:hypothetical protein